MCYYLPLPLQVPRTLQIPAPCLDFLLHTSLSLRPPLPITRIRHRNLLMSKLVMPSSDYQQHDALNGDKQRGAACHTSHLYKNPNEY